MRLSVEPNVIADDEVLDVLLAGNSLDEVSMLVETASRSLCRILERAADRAGVPADLLYRTSLDLKVRFTPPNADDFAEEIWEVE